MIWDIVYQISEKFYRVDSESKQLDLTVQHGTDYLRIQNHIDRVFAEYHCSPSVAACDLLAIALTVYSADKLALRKQAYNGWERGLNLHVPVTQLTSWQIATTQLEQTLYFLTDDRWRFHFRPNDITSNNVETQMSLFPQYSAVALLSGGLDSFIGAIDLLEKHDNRIAFVSHHAHSGNPSTEQTAVYSVLQRTYSTQAEPFRFYIQSPKLPEQGAESTSRSRSFLFLSLAVAVASALSVKKVYICENGYMTLNVPMTRSRIGSHSTRTTHPYFIKSFQELVSRVGLDVEIMNPYAFLTKGEMLQTCLNPQVLQEGLLQTRSCSRSHTIRFAKESPHAHCGYCLPCLVRNAATRSARLNDVSYLRTEKLKRAQIKDIWALKLLLKRLADNDLDITQQLAKCGKIPDSYEKYADVYERGLQELNLLRGEVL